MHVHIPYKSNSHFYKVAFYNTNMQIDKNLLGTSFLRKFH